jgi:hypothetical protein
MLTEESSSSGKNELVLIVGAGPAGLMAALAFHNSEYTNILIVESRPNFDFDLENSYPIGVNKRGENAIAGVLGNQPDIEKLGLLVDSWKIIVGPGINVANVESGLA